MLLLTGFAEFTTLLRWPQRAVLSVSTCRSILHVFKLVKQKKMLKTQKVTEFYKVTEVHCRKD